MILEISLYSSDKRSHNSTNLSFGLGPRAGLAPSFWLH